MVAVVAPKSCAPLNPHQFTPVNKLAEFDLLGTSVVGKYKMSLPSSPPPPKAALGGTGPLVH